jgi:meiotic recombination protein DMC1
MTPSRQLVKIKGFSELKVEKIKEAVAKALPPTNCGFVSAIELKHERKKVFQVSTGSKAFDTMLGG